MITTKKKRDGSIDYIYRGRVPGSKNQTTRHCRTKAEAEQWAELWQLEKQKRQSNLLANAMAKLFTPAVVSKLIKTKFSDVVISYRKTYFSKFCGSDGQITRSIAEHYSKIDLYISSKFPAEICIEDMSYEVLSSWWENLKAGKMKHCHELVPVSATTANKVLSILGKIFEHAEVYFQVKNIEWKKLLKMKESKENGRNHIVKKLAKKSILTLDEFQKFLDAEESDVYHLLYLIIYFSGLRLGEVLGLSVESFDFEEKLLMIYQQAEYLGNGKASISSELKTENSYRVLALPEFLVNAVREHIFKYQLKQKDLIFSSTFNGKKRGAYPMSRTAVRKHIKLAARKAGLDLNLYPHLFRHSTASYIVANNFTPEEASKVLGHSSKRITEDVYIHQSLEAKRQISEVMDNAFAKIVKRKVKNNDQN